MNQLDLLLVNAPSRIGVYQSLSQLAAIEPPVWAGLIARHCLNKGFSVEILDAEAEGLTIEQTAWRIAELRPRLAAFCIYGQQPSASTQCIPAASAVAKLLKTELRGVFQTPERGPNAPAIPILALGTHPSALPERTLREEPFDYVCQGEGPHQITGVLKQNIFTCNGNEVRGSLFPEHIGVSWSMPGIWHREHGPSCVTQNISDLDTELPGQAWELLDMTKYRAHNWHLWTGNTKGGYASVQTSLGCPYRCSFCCINAPFGGAGIRYWSPKNVATQIEHLVKDYGIVNIKIPDEMFVLNRNHVRDICEELVNRGLGHRLNIWAYARVDTVKDNYLLHAMRRAGFRWLGIGVESASKHVRDGVEKGRFGDEDIRKAIERVQGHGICVGANYIFGLPDDTQESMQQTLDLACALNTEWANFYCAMAYPGSPLHKIAKEKGWRLPEDEGGPGWIGYSQHSQSSMPLPTETLTYQEVLDFRDDAHLKYFARHEYLLMIDSKFGHVARHNVEQMLALGKPKRKHRDQREG